MTTKKELFFYFVFELINRYKELNPDIKLNRYHILKMLFFAGLANKNILDDLGKDLDFNNFYAMSKGPVESNCYYFIQEIGLKFEDKLKNIEDIKALFSIDKIEENLKNEIKKSINGIETFLFNKDHYFLIDYTHTFDSWKNAWKKCIIYNKKAYPINLKDILKESN